MSAWYAGFDLDGPLTGHARRALQFDTFGTTLAATDVDDLADPSPRRGSRPGSGTTAYVLGTFKANGHANARHGARKPDARPQASKATGHRNDGARS